LNRSDTLAAGIFHTAPASDFDTDADRDTPLRARAYSIARASHVHRTAPAHGDGVSAGSVKSAYCPFDIHFSGRRSTLQTERPIQMTTQTPAAGATSPILLWGPRESGKSTFLGCLLLRPDSTGDASDDASRWRVAPADTRASDYAADLIAQIQTGNPVQPTQVTEDPFWFKLQCPRGRGLLRRSPREWDLVLMDPSGEVFRPGVRTDTARRVLSLAGNARGLVLLIDAMHRHASTRYWEMFADNIGEMVRSLSEQEGGSRVLNRERRLTIPTAVCLTKMDLQTGSFAQPAELLRERLGSAYGLIQRSFTNYKIFSCSAFGNAAREQNADGTLRLVPRPWGLLEPFQWIIEPRSVGLVR
jgi:hypothetical protein